jgi:hypothetical protein
LWPPSYASCKTALVRRIGELFRKAWNPRAFKGHLSPHEFLQARPRPPLHKAPRCFEEW